MIINFCSYDGRSLVLAACGAQAEIINEKSTDTSIGTDSTITINNDVSKSNDKTTETETSNSDSIPVKEELSNGEETPPTSENVVIEDSEKTVESETSNNNSTLAEEEPSTSEDEIASPIVSVDQSPPSTSVDNPAPTSLADSGKWFFIRDSLHPFLSPFPSKNPLPIARQMANTENVDEMSQLDTLFSGKN